MTNKELKQILIENKNCETITAYGKMMVRLPIKYFDRVGGLSAESDLIDGCRFVLRLKEGWEWCGSDSVPVRSIAEAIRFVKESYEVKA